VKWYFVFSCQFRGWGWGCTCCSPWRVKSGKWPVVALWRSGTGHRWRRARNVAWTKWEHGIAFDACLAYMRTRWRAQLTWLGHHPVFVNRYVPGWDGRRCVCLWSRPNNGWWAMEVVKKAGSPASNRNGKGDKVRVKPEAPVKSRRRFTTTDKRCSSWQRTEDCFFCTHRAGLEWTSFPECMCPLCGWYCRLPCVITS